MGVRARSSSCAFALASSCSGASPGARPKVYVSRCARAIWKPRPHGDEWNIPFDTFDADLCAAILGYDMVRMNCREPARPWQDLSPWPSPSQTAPKCPGNLGNRLGVESIWGENSPCCSCYSVPDIIVTSRYLELDSVTNGKRPLDPLTMDRASLVGSRQFSNKSTKTNPPGIS